MRQLQLGGVGVLATVGHAKHPPRVVREVDLDFVGKVLLPDGFAALASAGGVAALDLEMRSKELAYHEVLDAAVELDAIVVAAAGQHDEVVARAGGLSC